MMVIAITFLIYSEYYLIDYKVIPADIRVSTYAGLNADADALHFGTIPSKGGFSIRKITLNSDEKARLEIKIDKDVDWLSVNKNNIIVVPGEPVELNFTGVEPSNYTLNETYSTNVKFYFYRVWN